MSTYEDVENSVLPPNPGPSLGKRLADSLPPAISAKLSDDEKELIAASIDLDREQPWRRLHPVDARYSFPWIGGRAYLRIMGGLETRTPDRTRNENKRGRARSLVNIAFIGIFAAVFYTLVAWGVLAASAVVG